MTVERLFIKSQDFAQKTVEGLYKDFERRIAASPPGQCPAYVPFAELRKVYALPCGSWSAAADTGQDT